MKEVFKLLPAAAFGAAAGYSFSGFVADGNWHMAMLPVLIFILWILILFK